MFWSFSMVALFKARVVEGAIASDPRRVNAARRDVIVVIVATILTWVLCASFEVNETLFRWSRVIERFQLDELPIVLLTLTVGLLWFSMRRYSEGNEIWEQQRRTDACLSVALDENRRLAQRYLNSLESERKQLARELHDELGQYLNAIKLDAVAIRQTMSGQSELKDIATSIERNTDHVYSVVSELIRQLRPVGLDELGLVAAIENLIDSWRQRLPSINIEFLLTGDLNDLSEQTNLTAFRIVQEGLTNIAKHSQANNVSVRLSQTSANNGQSVVIIDIEDDGLGSDLSKSREGFGLVGIRERVEMHGGLFAVNSIPQNGFVLNVSFPV
jgi:two-component system, NarL family, sensor histidine kinase UhpB